MGARSTSFCEDNGATYTCHPLHHFHHPFRLKRPPTCESAFIYLRITPELHLATSIIPRCNLLVKYIFTSISPFFHPYSFPFPCIFIAISISDIPFLRSHSCFISSSKSPLGVRTSTTRHTPSSFIPHFQGRVGIYIIFRLCLMVLGRHRHPLV